MASHKLIADTNEHSEEQATLRGKRLIIAEELTEKRALNVTAIKRISDVASITARRRAPAQHDIQDDAYVVRHHELRPGRREEVDHGTWRRLALCPFPFTFRKPHEGLTRPTDRPGDPGLKDNRIERNVSGQHDAIVTWVVDGARTLVRGRLSGSRSDHGHCPGHRRMAGDRRPHRRVLAGAARARP